MSLINIIEKFKTKKPFIEKIENINEIFDLKSFENYINTNTFVLDKNFHIKYQKNEYYWDRNNWDVFDKIIPSEALDVMLDEETCVITNAKKLNKNIQKIIGYIEDIIKLETDCHLFYCSDKVEDKGLGRHHDKNDNFIMQIYGSTDLTIWGNELIEKTLNPGDVFYIPRLTDHCLKSKTKRLSLSFPMAYESKINRKDYWIKL